LTSPTEDQLDLIGRLSDKADNFLAASKMQLPDSMHLECMKGGMGDFKKDLRDLYIAISGKNPWER